MNEKSMLIPPNGAEKLASRLDPPEYGTSTLFSSVGLLPQQGVVHTHRHLVFVAYFSDLRHFFSRLRIRHSNG